MLEQKPFGEGDEIVLDGVVSDGLTDVVDVEVAPVDDARADLFGKRLKEAFDLEGAACVEWMAEIEHLIDQRRPSAVYQVLHCSKSSPCATVARVAALRSQVVADDLEILAEVHASFDVARRRPNTAHVLRILYAEPRREIPAKHRSDEDDASIRQPRIFTSNVIDQVRDIGENLFD